MGSTELVKHRPIQTVVDGVEGKTLGPSLRLKWKKNREDREVKQGKLKSSVWLSHCSARNTDSVEIFQPRFVKATGAELA